MSETTPDKGPLEQRMTVQADGTVTCLSKDWFYQPGEKDNFYTVRTSHVQPLICGAETMPRILQVLQSAEKSIDIGVWCFDPALSLNGYNKALNKSFDLFDSLKPPLNASPRIGDVLFDAASRGVEIRITVWTLGDLVYNPLHWDVLADNFLDIVKEFGEFEIEKYWEMIKKYSGITFDDIFDVTKKVILAIVAICIVLFKFGRRAVKEIAGICIDFIKDCFFNNINFFSNFAFRILWYENLKKYPNVKIRTIGQDITPELVKEFLNAFFGVDGNESNANRYDENGFLEKKYAHILLKEKVNTHHQKCIIVDYKNPNAVGFVMGNNLKMVDFDSLEHPEDAGENGGRFPNQVPRQDISSFIRGKVLDDISDNYNRIWEGAARSRACVEGGALENPSWVDRLKEASKLITRIIEELSRLGPRNGLGSLGQNSSNVIQSVSGVPDLWQKLPKGNCQLSTTLIQHERGESYIAKAYRRALDCCTSFVYFENQYFRYDTLAKALAQRAKTRFAAKESQRGDPLYFFVVVNDVESFAFSTTYPVMETLGHAGQMPAEEHRRYKELWDDKEKLSELEDEESKAQLEKVETEMAELERYYPQLKPGEKPKKPLTAEEIREAKDAFTLNEDPSLKGHITVLLISKKSSKPVEILSNLLDFAGGGKKVKDTGIFLKKLFFDTKLFEDMYTYEPVNVHTKTMIVDDVFIIIGSANMHQRGMEYDNEIDISTTRPGAARDTRRTLFAAYTENNEMIMNEQSSWADIHDGWKKLLDKNWERHFKWKKLQGMLFYFYNPSVSSKIVTLD